MKPIFDNFMETLNKSGLGQMLAFALVSTVMLSVWAFKRYIFKKLDLDW